MRDTLAFREMLQIMSRAFLARRGFCGMSKAATAKGEPGLSVRLTWFVRWRIWFHRRCAIQDWNFEVPGLVLSTSSGMNPFSHSWLSRSISKLNGEDACCLYVINFLPLWFLCLSYWWGPPSLILYFFAVLASTLHLLAFYLAMSCALPFCALPLAGISKVQPAGRIRPIKVCYPAHVKKIRNKHKSF